MPKPAQPPSRFLPALRLREDLLLLWREILPRYRDLRLMNLLETPWAILSETRQILLANASFQALTASPKETIIGKRPGEVLACLHALGAGDCGTTEACRTCGAAQAIHHALEKGTPTFVSTSFLRRQKNQLQGMNAQITAAPFQVGFTPFLLFSLSPTTEATQHEVLERLFYHDLLNGMNSIIGALNVLRDYRLPGEIQDFLQVVLDRAWGMAREIQNYKTISAVERGTFSATLMRFDIAALCQQLASLYRAHPLAKDKTIAAELPPTLSMISDPQLVTRIVENLLKNALEASNPKDTVSLCLRQEGNQAVLTMANPAVMPDEVQGRIFQRGHSTKGTGRGFGTYGVRLFVENYLAGTVSFQSTPATGTVFTVRLPLRHPLGGDDTSNEPSEAL